MLVRDLMTKDVVTVKPTDTVNEVAEVLFQNHFTGLPVVDEHGKLLGMIAERDFITSDSRIYLPTYIKLLQEMDYIRGDKKFMSEDAAAIVNATAADIMNRSVVTTSGDTNIEQLAELFATKRVNPIPVVDPYNKILGIISRSDLIKLFSKKRLEPVGILENTNRAIDSDVNSIYTSFRSRFAYVAKFRANVWLTIAIVLFVIGFVAGIIYVVDPNIFQDQAPEDIYSSRCCTDL